jgi:hypothetical protein
MTRSPAIRINLLLGCMIAAVGILLALSASSAHAQGNSAIDQYLENNPDGRQGSGGGSKGGGSGGGSAGGSASSGQNGSGGSSGSGSGGGSDDHATKDYNGDGTINSTDDKIAAKKKAKKKKDKKDDEKTSGIAGAGDDGGTGGSSSSPQLANQTVPAQDDGGSSGALWIVLALIVLGPLAVIAFLRFGPRRKGRGGTSEPQGT